MRGLCWVIALLVVLARPASSDTSSRLVIDRVDLEPASLTGQRLHVHLSGLSPNGQVLDLTEPRAIKVLAGGSQLKAPYVLGRFGATTADAAIIFVVQATVEFADVLPVIAEAIDQSLLAGVGDRTQVALLSYGEAPGSGKLGSLKTGRSKIAGLTGDGSAGDPALITTIERALAMFKRARTNPPGRPLRKMIVVIGDGRDVTSDRDHVRRVGERAARDNVRIHSFAYAPTDVRRPLLLLGELSKRSHGTFRWIRGRGAESWTPPFLQLRDEITKQYVVTLFLDADTSVEDKKIKVTTTGRVELTSANEVKAPKLSCAGEPCELGSYCTGDRCAVALAPQGRGVFGWILLIVLIGVGAVVVLGAIGYAMSRRQGPPLPAPGMPGAPPLPPGVVPPVAGKQKRSKPPRSAPLAPPVVAPPANGPKLYVLSGPRSGETLALRNGFAIGKAPGNDLQIDDGYTSSQHAQIGMDATGKCWVHDRGSTNGTFVNGVRVTEYILEHGMTVKIGSTELRFLAQ